MAEYYEISGHIINAGSIQYVTPSGVVHFGGKEVKMEDPAELEALKRILKTKKLAPKRGTSDAEQHQDYPKFNPALAEDGPDTNDGADDAGKSTLLTTDSKDDDSNSSSKKRKKS